MKQVENRQLSLRLASMVVVVVLISTAEPLTSQRSDINSTLLRYYCSLYKGMNKNYFLNNLNTTLSSLRRQLSNNRVHYATGRTLLNGEPVWGLAWCRGYVTSADCLNCFDIAVAQLKGCGLANGANVIYSDCVVRYETNNFYTEATGGWVICGNTISPQPTEFRKAAQQLFSDLRIATPRAPNFYAASTRRVAGGNATVYAIAQCILNISQSVCEECLKLRYSSVNDCLPSTSGSAMDNGCLVRYSRTPFFGQNQTTNITPLLWDDDSSERRSIIGGVVGGVSFLLLVLAFFLWRHRSKNASGGQQDKSTGSTELLQGPATFSYNDLKAATNNFSDEFKLGGGVFGEVYKGTLKGGDTVAIKKTVMASTRGNIHFDDALKIISNVHHRHLIRLLGYCRKGTLLFLVHEYMDNGSLDQFLYYGYKTRNLNWKQRFEIIFGTARGLAYLHEEYHVTIIHTDIKTSNILLDNEFRPKIADFGLIRLLPEDNTHLSTKLAGSSVGDVAPEYAIHGQLSEKVDTYSFGVVVLEIISGKRYNDAIDDKSVTQSLLDHAWNLYESGTHLNLMDDALDPSEYAAEDAMKIIEVALMCTQSPVSARPAMSEVVILLNDKSLEETPPVRSTFPDDEVRIQVDTATSLATNAIASTIQLSRH